jgi:hypothetical protein
MDILNFISWIRGGRYITSVDSTKTLVPVAVKDDKRDDSYLACAITVQNLAASSAFDKDRLVAGTREVVLTDNAGNAELTFDSGTAIIQTSGVGSDLFIRTLTGDDIILESGDDITLRGDKGAFDQIAEGGDINILAGDGSDGNTQNSGNGGDITIQAGSAGTSVSGLQAPGGQVGISGGYSTLTGTSGGDITITPGNSVSNLTGFVYISGNNIWGFDTSTGALYFPKVGLATLPSAGSVSGARAMINDSTVTASGNFGAIAAGGGSDIVPVFSDGTNWLIG